MFGLITIHAGDFDAKKGGCFNNEVFTLHTATSRMRGETISAARIASLEIADEETTRSFLGTAGMAALGTVLLGPVGLLAGALAGGKKKSVTFIAEFNDGRQLLATTDSGTFTAIRAAVMNTQAKSRLEFKKKSPADDEAERFLTDISAPAAPTAEDEAIRYLNELGE